MNISHVTPSSIIFHFNLAILQQYISYLSYFSFLWLSLICKLKIQILWIKNKYVMLRVYKSPWAFFHSIPLQYIV